MILLLQDNLLKIYLNFLIIVFHLIFKMLKILYIIIKMPRRRMDLSVNIPSQTAPALIHGPQTEYERSIRRRSNTSSKTSSRSDTSKIRSTESSKSYDEKEIDEICKNNLTEIKNSIYKEELKKLKNKLIKICSKYINNKKIKTNKKDNLLDKFLINKNLLLPINIRDNLLKELFERDVKFKKKFLKVITHQQPFENGLNIVFLEDDVRAHDLGGPQKEFIDLLTTKINNIEENIFIKLDNDVYIPNIHLSLDNAKKILNSNSLKSVEDFYYFIGQIVFFLLKAKSGLKIKLAKTLLFRMLIKYNNSTFKKDKYKILQHEYYFYYILDKKNLKTFEYLYTSSFEKLNKELMEDFKNEKDLYEYMIKTAHEGCYFNDDIINSFIKGFHSISRNLYNHFTENKISVIELDNMLFLTELTIDKIREILIPKILNKYKDEEQLPIQIEAFKEILLNNVEFPQNFIDSEKEKKENENKIYPINHIEFVELLLKFWTGSSILYKEDKYIVFISDEDYKLNSSTCFNHLTLGTFEKLNIEEIKLRLYELLIIEITKSGFTDR